MFPYTARDPSEGADVADAPGRGQEKHTCMIPLMPCTYPIQLLLPFTRYTKADRQSPLRTLTDASSSAVHARPSCKYDAPVERLAPPDEHRGMGVLMVVGMVGAVRTGDTMIR
jgi:hypothetical protein